MSRPTYRLPSAERWRGPEPFIGKRCRVTYRNGTYGAFTGHVEGIVLGASHHLTNGNSTGDLIVQCEPGYRWNFGGGNYRVVSIALAHVGEIEEIPR